MNASTIGLLALALSLVAATPTQAAPASASEQLLVIDKTTENGALSVVVTTYGPASPKTHERGEGTTLAATLLFERPGRFKLVLDPGGKYERRVVGDGETATWFDRPTGLQGKAKTSDVMDPTLIALLGTVAELQAYAAAKDFVLDKKSPVIGAQLIPAGWGNSAVAVNAWLHDGQPTGFSFELADGGRIFVAVMSFKANVPLKPSDFKL